MLRKLLEILLARIPIIFVLVSFASVLIFRWVPVYTTPLMIKRSIVNHCRNEKQWVKLEDVSPYILQAFIAAEDSHFYQHNGFDLNAITTEYNDARMDERRPRGCSTISQQTAKNCFTFCSSTWFRKAVETYYTVLIELFWSKDRILEVYVNVVETGVNLFGVEAACQKYFDSDASEVSKSDAIALACCLPNPLQRNPQWAYRNRADKMASIARSVN